MQNAFDDSVPVVNPLCAAPRRGLELSPLNTPETRRRAIELALDYRGDVTLLLSDGIQVTGYLYNRMLEAPEQFVELLIAGSEFPLRIAAAQITGIVFTGTDAAAGKSWEAWLEKVAQAEASGAIAELYPDALDV